MAAKEKQTVKQEPENPSFNGIEFTELSKEYLFVHQAIQFAVDQGDGAILQSAREAGVFRITGGARSDTELLPGTDAFSRSEGKLLTRTAAIYFKLGDKFYAAIDDTINPEQDILIAHAQKAYDYNMSNAPKHFWERDDGGIHKYLLPVNDALVKGVLLRAEKSGRIVEATTDNLPELKTKAVDGKSEFGQNDWNKAVFIDAAEPYAGMLNQRGREVSRIFYVSPVDLEAMGVDGNFVNIEHVSLGRTSSTEFEAVGQFLMFSGGYACGVRNAKSFSTGNRERVVTLDEKIYAQIKKMLE